MSCEYEIFRGTGTWESIHNRAAAFVSTLAPGELINITVTLGSGLDIGAEGIITVWYWVK